MKKKQFQFSNWNWLLPAHSVTFFFEFWIVSGPLLIDFHLIHDSITLFFCHMKWKEILSCTFWLNVNAGAVLWSILQFLSCDQIFFPSSHEIKRGFIFYLFIVFWEPFIYSSTLVMAFFLLILVNCQIGILFLTIYDVEIISSCVDFFMQLYCLVLFLSL